MSRLFIGGVSRDVQHGDLMALLSRFGEVKALDIKVRSGLEY